MPPARSAVPSSASVRTPTASHLCAWAGVAPASYEPAGKRRPAGTRHGSQWLRRALIEAARAGARTKGSYYSAQYAPIARRRGPHTAAVAVANSMLFTIWYLLSTGAFYEDPGADYFKPITIRPSRRSDSRVGSRSSASPSV
ncbi:MAG: transposase [Acidimicrobiales bacterium]